MQINFSDSSTVIQRLKGTTLWLIKLTSLSGRAPDICTTVFFLSRVLKNVDVSFCFSEPPQSLDLSMLCSTDDQQIIIKLLQSVANNHTQLMHLNTTTICFADSKGHAVGLLCKVLSPPSVLEHLVMMDCSVDDSTCALIADQLKLNTSLKILSLADNCIKSKGAITLFQALKGNSSLIVLNLNCNDQLTSGDDQELFIPAIKDMLQSDNFSLEVLDLSYCNISDKHCMGLSCGLAGNKTLNKLVLQGNKFTGGGIIELLKNSTKLEHLNLSFNKQLAAKGNHEELLGNAFEQLLCSSSSLLYLNLCGSINDKIAKLIISGLRSNPNLQLRELDVNNCQLNADTVTNLLDSCKYEEFVLHVTEMKCTYKSDDFCEWWSLDSIIYHSSNLFYLLILSESGRITEMGQRAYREVNSIRDLDFRNCDISYSQFFSITESLKFIQNLTRLDLSGNNHLLDGTPETSNAVCSALNKALLDKQIEELDVSDIGIHPLSWQRLFAGLSSASSLKVLDISCNTLGGNGSMALIRMLTRFSGVIKLNVNGDDTFFSDEDNFVDVTTKDFTLSLFCDKKQLHLLHLLLKWHLKCLILHV